MNMNNKVKLLGTIIGIIMFVLLIAGVSYAWITWQSSNINITGSSSCFDVNYTNGQTLTNESVILFDESSIINDGKITIKNGMAITDVTVGISSSCDITGNLEIILNVTSLNSAYISGNSIGAFKYVLASYDPSNYTNITTSALNGVQFDIIKNESITSTGEKVLVNEGLSTTEKGYMIIFYVDGDLAMNDAQNSTFSTTLTGIATQTQTE